jgi:hypothetical protein
MLASRRKHSLLIALAILLLAAHLPFLVSSPGTIAVNVSLGIQDPNVAHR